MRAHTQGLIAINLAAVIFGTAALYGKLPIHPIWMVAVRAGFASVALYLIAFFRGELRGQKASHLPTLIRTGAVLCFHWVTFFYSVQKGGVAVATLTFACYPFFSILLEAIGARRLPRPLELAAGTASILAVFLLVDSGSSREPLFVGAVVGLLSAAAFAWFGISCKRIAGVLSPVWVSLVQNLVVMVLLVPFLPFTDLPPREPMHWFWLFTQGVVTTALMHQLYLYALKRLSASTCGAFVALEPVYAILFAAWIFDEPVTMTIVVSGLLILGGALILLRRDART